MYAILAHKPYSEDYHRDRHIASYQSDIQFSSGLHREDLINHLAKYLKQNKQLKTNEDGYHLIIFNTGIVIYNDLDSTGRTFDAEMLEEYNTDAYWKLHEKENEYNRDLDGIFLSANSIADSEITKEKQKAKIELETQKQQEIKLDQEKQRRLYEQLKQKFEPTQTTPN